MLTNHGPVPDAGASRNPRIRLFTSLGDVVMELYADRAPLASAAFLEAVDRGDYNGGGFPRIVRSDNDRGTPTIEVIQGHAASASPRPDVPLETTRETGIRHEDGVISLPRMENTDSSVASFFICIGDQPALDAGGGRIGDGRGFAAFGRVTEGMNVVRAIHRTETLDSAPSEYLRGQLAAMPTAIYRMSRLGQSPTLAVPDLAADYWAFRVHEFPLEATSAGLSSQNRRLEGVRHEDHDRRAALAGTLLARCAAINATALDELDRTNLALLRDQLRSIVDAYELQEHRRPRLFPAAFFQVAESLVRMTALETFQAREDLAQRLACVPAYLEGSLAELRAGFAQGYRLPVVLVPRVLTLLGSQLSPAEGLLAEVQRRLSGAVPGTAQDKLDEQRHRIEAIVVNRVLPSLRQMHEFVGSLRAADLTDRIGVSAQPDGRAYYRYKVRQQTSTELDPDAIHELGRHEVNRLHQEIEAVLVKMQRAGERRAVAEELNRRTARDGDALLATARALAKRIDGLLPRVIGRFPRITYAVEPLGAAASTALPPAFAQPSPADASMPGIYWLTALPERCPLHLLPALTLHEAWPGHLMQLALANELEGVPMFRRYCWSEYMGYVEGWALYCERLGSELGLYSSAEDEFGRLSFDVWRAARLVVDTGIHWLDWSRSEAVDYMVANTVLPLDTVAAEVDRYIGMPAQALSYKIGERVISALREAAESTLAERFSLRRFHDRVMQAGPVPLHVLEHQVRGWIQGEAA